VLCGMAARKRASRQREKTTSEVPSGGEKEKRGPAMAYSERTGRKGAGCGEGRVGGRRDLQEIDASSGAESRIDKRNRGRRQKRRARGKQMDRSARCTFRCARARGELKK